MDGAILLVNSTYHFLKSIPAFYDKTCKQSAPYIKNHPVLLHLTHLSSLFVSSKIFAAA